MAGFTPHAIVTVTISANSHLLQNMPKTQPSARKLDKRKGHSIVVNMQLH